MEVRMSHVSSGVEYALHCLLHLTEAPFGVGEASVRDLAELQGLSVEYVAKLFTKLHKAGLTTATEGARGGFRLARPADKISVLDVMIAVDGPKSLFDCREIRANCAVFEGAPPRWATQGVCSIHAVMLEAEKRMTDVLAAQTLASLADNVATKAPRSYHKSIVHWIDSRSASRRTEQR
jgi:Rrf2 family protein